ncbi:MAG: heme o synthase [Polyangiaceae bacterium]
MTQNEPPARVLSTPRSQLQLLRDVVSLTKPRITGMVLFTTFGGYWLAGKFFGVSPSLRVLAPLLVGTAMVVGGANALNMYVERDSDRLMARTRLRPLAARRLAPEVALVAGVGLGALSVPLMTFAVSAMTGLLAAIALLSYVVVYTPLKRKTPTALLIGAVPGAIPPLMGWSAARGTIDGPGIVLFGIMFFWQVPHFLAIATFRKAEYARANMAVLPVVAGDRITRHHVVRYLAALLLTSILLVPYGVGGRIYFATAIVLGLGFFGVGLWGLRPSAGDRWARGLFFTSMIYLTGMFVALTLGGATRAVGL